MDAEVILRIIFFELVILLSAVQLILRGYTGRTMKKPEVIDKTENKSDMAVIIAFMPLWAISVMIYPFGFDWFNWSIETPSWFRWFGIFLMTISFPLSVQVFLTLGENFSPKLEVFENHQIVSHGPYKFVRHPMYAVFILCAIGSSMASANLFVTISSIGASTALILRIRHEEAMLLKRFGQSYGDYQKRTGAILPKLT